MTAAQHTPGPWAYRLESPGEITQEVYPVANSSYPIGLVWPLTGNHRRAVETVEANAARIVACVNACEGINPEAVPETLEEARKLLAQWCPQ